MIYRMLKNPLYVGKVRHKDVSYPGEHEAIIDQKLWDDVQILLQGNLRHDPRSRNSKHNPFMGLLYCGHCGGAMSLAHTKKGNKRYNYYICLEDTKRNFKICPVQRVPTELIQKAILEHIGTLLQSPVIIAKLQEKDKSISTKKLREVMKNFLHIWNVMCYIEQCRFLRNAIKKISLFEDHIKVEPNVEGIGELFKDIGCEV